MPPALKPFVITPLADTIFACTLSSPVPCVSLSHASAAAKQPRFSWDPTRSQPAAKRRQAQCPVAKRQPLGCSDMA